MRRPYPTGVPHLGQNSKPSPSSKPQEAHPESGITPPHVTLAVLDEVEELGIENVWMQPGAERAEVIARCDRPFDTRLACPQPRSRHTVDCSDSLENVH